MLLSNKIKLPILRAEYSASVIVLLLAFLTSPHILLSDNLGIRFELQLIMCVLILLVFVKTVNKTINKNGIILFFLAIAMFAGELLYRFQINKLAGYLLACMLIYVVLVTRGRGILRFIDGVNRINYVFALLGLSGLALSFMYPPVFNAIKTLPAYYNRTFPSGTELLTLFGHADSWLIFGETKFLRMTGQLNQASLLPAYILLPLSIAMVYSKIRTRTVMVILLPVVLTLGGTAYFALFSAAMVYIFSRYVNCRVMLAFPFVFLPLFLAVLFLLFHDTYDPEAVKAVTRNAANAIQSADPTDPILNRIGSGVARLMLISYSTLKLIVSTPFPVDTKTLLFTIGSNIVTSGLRGGLIGLLLAVLVYYKLFAIIAVGLSESRTKSRTALFGFSLMYSLVFQAMIYNDFGFSTYYALVMFACIIVLSDSKRSYQDALNKKEIIHRHENNTLPMIVNPDPLPQPRQ